MRVGQLLLWAELEWDSLCCGRIESATVIIVDRVSVDRYYCGQSEIGTGIIVDRLR